VGFPHQLVYKDDGKTFREVTRRVSSGVKKGGAVLGSGRPNGKGFDLFVRKWEGKQRR